MMVKAALIVSAVFCVGISVAMLIGDYYLYVYRGFKSDLAKSASICAAAAAIYAAVSSYLK